MTCTTEQLYSIVSKKYADAYPGGKIRNKGMTLESFWDYCDKYELRQPDLIRGERCWYEVSRGFPYESEIILEDTKKWMAYDDYGRACGLGYSRQEALEDLARVIGGCAITQVHAASDISILRYKGFCEELGVEPNV